MNFTVDTYTKAYTKKSDHHLYITPDPALQQVVAHYTITFPNVDVKIPDHGVLNLIPDVSGCFVFHFKEDVSITVWGATTEVVTVENDLNRAPCRFFVEFLPAGLHQVLGIDMKQYLNRKIDLKIINSILYNEIHECFQTMNTFDEIVTFMNQILIREIKKHPIEGSILQCIESIDRNHESVNAKEVAKKLQISERQLSRYFNNYVGMGIKKYSKIVTINHLLQNISQQNLIDLTFHYDYFDQAHFNHVFKEICGTTPTSYLKNLSDFYNELYKF